MHVKVELYNEHGVDIFTVLMAFYCNLRALNIKQILIWQLMICQT